MKKKMFKILRITIILVILLNVFVNLSFADNWINPDDYKPSITQSTNDYDDVQKKVGTVLGYIKLIGIFVSVGVLMVLGIKYMIGSVEERASYKRTFIPYLIGAFILFTGTLLPSVIYDFAHKL